MKKNIKLFSALALFVMGALFTQSCEKIKDAVSFKVEQDLPDHHFDLDSAATSSKGENLLYQAYYEINIDSVFEANGIDKGKISDGKFKQIIIKVDDSDTQMNFGFLESLSFRLGDSDNAMEAVTIAAATNIKDGDMELIFDVNDDSVDKYLEQDRFYFFVFGKILKPVPVEQLPLLIKSKIEFQVNPLD
ncbi:MAG: hypothetical protein DRI86_14475 [Bacteroidetes bacterium]|nr:MAG: hypothetical protein DRI86_14475 [Bacteroidota bacterium]